MSNRIAFFADAADLRETFDLDESREVIFDPHYNIARGHHIPVLTEHEGVFSVERIRWGEGFEKKSTEPATSRDEDVVKLEKRANARAVIPISGFYIWKSRKKEDHPFFVRKIDNSLLYAAGFIFRDQAKDFPYAEMVITDSNTLIQPISESMPCILKEGLAKEWLRKNMSASELLDTANSQFLITDLTVHRVSKEINDLSKNEKSLIQPIPK